jgi:hypothetical protein
MRVARAVFITLFFCAALPSFAIVAINGPLTQEHSVEPGKTYEGTIQLTNPDKAAQEIKAYQTDYFFSADGTVSYGQAGGLPRSNAHWISLSPAQVKIPAGETVAIHYTIQVPSDKTLKGTYWSMIMVEPIMPGSPESGTYDPGKVTMGMKEVLRYGIQIVTSIGSTGTGALKFTSIRLQADNGKRFLIVDAENTGERWLRATLWAELYDSEGAYVGKFDGGRHRVFPGTSARFTAELQGVKGTTYKALIVADCGGDDVFGATVSLVLRE